MCPALDSRESYRDVGLVGHLSFGIAISGGGVNLASDNTFSVDTKESDQDNFLER